MKKPYYMHNKTLYRKTPDVDLEFLQHSFDNVPYDHYFADSQRFRTTSRVEITDSGFKLLPKLPLFQPTYVNKIAGYGGISRDYEDAPLELIESDTFEKLILEWISVIPFEVSDFSVHQIRTTGTGIPTPEGRHKDGTYWTGLYILKRHNIVSDSARTTYWDLEDNIVLQDCLQEGELMSFNDPHYTHGTTGLEPADPEQFAYRDVFVLTVPEHGVVLPDDAGDRP